MAPGMARLENAGEGPSRLSTGEMTLNDAMRAPSTNPPGVVVLDTMHGEGHRDVAETLDPKEDLWLSSADGRFNSPIIPLRVGTAPECETFYVHKSVLLKAEFFRKALCGEFRESEAQAIDLPEENPAIFHFVVAFLYENKYVPIRPAAAVLISDEPRQGEDEHASSDSDTSVVNLSDSSTAQTQRRRERRRRRVERHWDRMRRKHPGAHRLGCACRQCLARGGPPCWNCAAPRLPPQPNVPMHVDVPPGIVIMNAEPPRPHNRRRRPNRHRQPSPPGSGNNSSGSGVDRGDRIRGQDLHTWLLAYELNIDVYICANKFLLEDFKRAVARACIDQLETAGADAAQAEVLRLCARLYEGLPESDALLRMVFARVGFLHPHLWRGSPDATAAFFHAHPEVAALMFRETLVRRELEHADLPAMERPALPRPPPAAFPRNDPRAFLGARGWGPGRGDF
ncbi:hypothetical protein F4818DRAFT_161723 [Hypoxylon cercidicola]|nr:hypothetical protein F4818DRAFT_161723 [Hypoxylon cercidicola]